MAVSQAQAPVINIDFQEAVGVVQNILEEIEKAANRETTFHNLKPAILEILNSSVVKDGIPEKPAPLLFLKEFLTFFVIDATPAWDCKKIITSSIVAAKARQYLDSIPVIRAASEGKIDEVKKFLEKFKTSDWKEKSGIYGTTFLYSACMGGHLALAKKLVEEYKHNVNAKNASNLSTPLHIAAHKLYPEICEYLLQNGALVHNVNSLGTTPFVDVFSQPSSEKKIKILQLMKDIPIDWYYESSPGVLVQVSLADCSNLEKELAYLDLHRTEPTSTTTLTNNAAASVLDMKVTFGNKVFSLLKLSAPPPPQVPQEVYNTATTTTFAAPIKCFPVIWQWRPNNGTQWKNFSPETSEELDKQMDRNFNYGGNFAVDSSHFGSTTKSTTTTPPLNYIVYVKKGFMFPKDAQLFGYYDQDKLLGFVRWIPDATKFSRNKPHNPAAK